MKTHNGKIGRLPASLREQLNLRLNDGESAGPLLAWLNAQPETLELLARDFGSEPVSEQNLTNWRQGGHVLWLKQQERRELVRQMARDAGELESDAGGVEVGHHWSALLTAELAQTATEVLETVTEPIERCVRLQELLQTLVRVRREDFRAGKLKIERERRERERLKEQADDEWRQENEPWLRSMKRSSMAVLFAAPDITSQALATQQAESILRDASPVSASPGGFARPNQGESR